LSFESVRVSRTDTTVLALDVHGGDGGLDVTIPAAIAALACEPALRIILVGDQKEIESRLGSATSYDRSRIEVQGTHSVLPMDAKPAAVLRRGRDSSLWKVFELVAEEEADACVSSGSTAAMMVLGVRVIGMLPGIQRPALMASVPNQHGYTGLLDLGANLSVSAEQLVQFAVMGEVKARVVDGIERPRVGLLNVGHEDGKGHELIRMAKQMLNELPINTIGFIEGHDIFDGKVDVAVCDGFVGNLILKSAEGLARMMQTELKAAFSSNWVSRLGATLLGPSLSPLLKRTDPAAHNSAPLLGLNGVAVKSHGSADAAALTGSILEAGKEARRQVPKMIEASIHQHHLETEF
jgi:glycerol-3-phosphate acyltransferase PlsX